LVTVHPTFGTALAGRRCTSHVLVSLLGTFGHRLATADFSCVPRAYPVDATVVVHSPLVPNAARHALARHAAAAASRATVRPRAARGRRRRRRGARVPPPDERSRGGVARARRPGRHRGRGGPRPFLDRGRAGAAGQRARPRDPEADGPDLAPAGPSTHIYGK